MADKICWAEYKNVTIRDVHMKWHKRICDFMFRNFFQPHPLYRLMQMQEEDGATAQYLAYLTHILRGECCIVAVDEQTNEIYAVAIVKWMTKEWGSWTCLNAVMTDCNFTEVITLCERMLEEYQYTDPEHPFNSLHLFEYFIGDQLKDDVEFKEKFFYAICETARHMNMPRVTFMALSTAERQDVLEIGGFTELCQTLYSMYNTKNGHMFSILRDVDEMHASFCELLVPPLQPYKEMTVRELAPPRTLLLQVEAPSEPAEGRQFQQR